MSDIPGVVESEPSAGWMGSDSFTWVQEWITRLVVTIGIVVAFQLFNQRPVLPQQPKSNRLDQEWKTTQELEKQQQQQETRGGSTLLDRLEARQREMATKSYEKKEDDDPTTVTSDTTAPQPKEEAGKVQKEVDPELKDEAEEGQEVQNQASTTETMSSESRPRRSHPVARVTSNDQAPSLPPMKATHSYHPGLGGFRSWFEVEASLYRIYTVGRTDDQVVSTPFIPKSERGQVGLHLNIHNQLFREISVYWVDYKGKEVLRGSAKQGRTYAVQTYIGHPWTIRVRETGKLVCHYIPYRIIQHTEAVPTVDPVEPEVGVHRFTIRRNKDSGIDKMMCIIDDPVFPTNIQTPHDASAWSFQQMSRVEYPYAETLQKYLTNIVRQPSETKYRQIRIANPKFFSLIWNTPARGLLLASGFVEQGAYAELGCAGPLPRERVQELSRLLFFLEKWRTAEERRQKLDQPEGADGYGRAGYGREAFGYGQ